MSDTENPILAPIVAADMPTWQSLAAQIHALAARVPDLDDVIGVGEPLVSLRISFPGVHSDSRERVEKQVHRVGAAVGGSSFTYSWKQTRCGDDVYSGHVEMDTEVLDERYIDVYVEGLHIPRCFPVCNCPLPPAITR